MAADKSAKADISEDELDQIIQDMSTEDAAAAAPGNKPVLEVVPAVVPAAKKESAPSPSPSSPFSTETQSLVLELNGEINLKLRFTSGGRTISLHCTEETLICQLADGMEFRIPTGAVKPQKKSA